MPESTAMDGPRAEGDDAGFEAYEAALREPRRCFDSRCGVTALAFRTRTELHAFLIQYSAFGTLVTAPVEGWIRSAGERCLALGHEALGRDLIAHARHEAGHDAWMRADAAALIELWNHEGELEHLDLAKILANPPPSNSLRYRELHERTITGPAPYSQIAIEYEIEALSLRWAIPLLGEVRRFLGEEVRGALRFLPEHAVMDEGHTAFNRIKLRSFLARTPPALPALVAAGREALECYGGFVLECRDLARELGAAA